MNYEELLEYLGLENASEFGYFENMADIIESENPISYEALKQLVATVNLEKLKISIVEYFEDVLEALPDEETELCTLMETVKMSFSGMIDAMLEVNELSRSDLIVNLTGELCRFTQWYGHESVVNCASKKDGSKIQMPLMEAITLYRLENLTEASYTYDFADCWDYRVEEYTLIFREEDMYDDTLYEEIDDDEGDETQLIL